MAPIRFSICGITPAPQGSKRWLPNGRLVEQSSQLRPWRQAVSEAALQARRAEGMDCCLDGPLSVALVFLFARPASHYGRRGLRPSAPLYKVSTPDIDKLSRAVLDAITHVLIRDDAQVVSLSAAKRYASADELPGAIVTLLPQPTAPLPSRTAALLQTADSADAAPSGQWPPGGR